MPTPVNNGRITVGQDILNYRGNEPRRLCLQKAGNLWEIHLARPDEAHAPSWYTDYNRISAIASRAFGRLISRPPPPDPERILLDASIAMLEPERGVPRFKMIYFQDTENSIHDRHSDSPDQRIASMLNGITKLNDRQHFCTSQAANQLTDDAQHFAMNAYNALRAATTAPAPRQTRLARAAPQPRPPAPAPRTHSLLLNIRTDQLQNNPAAVMRTISEAFLTQEATGRTLNAINVSFADAEGRPGLGIDAGGLSREFITKIFHSLIDPENSDGLPSFSFEPVPGGVLPIVSARDEEGKPALTAEGARDLNSMGRLIGICFQNNQYHTGQIFPTPFFHASSHLTPDEAISLIDHPPSPDILRKLYIALNPESSLVRGMNPDALDDTALTNLLYGVYPEGIPEDPFGDGTDAEVIRKNSATLQKDIDNLIVTESAPEDPRTQAMVKVIAGMASQIGRQDWEQISGQNPTAIQTRVQGQMSKEMFLRQIRQGFEAATPTRAERENHARVRGFLEKWVEKNDLEKIQQLLFAMTGSRTLGPMPLLFQVDSTLDKNSMPTYHTCFYQMILPAYSSEEELEQIRTAPPEERAARLEAVQGRFDRLLDMSIEYSIAQGYDQR